MYLEHNTMGCMCALFPVYIVLYCTVILIYMTYRAVFGSVRRSKACTCTLYIIII